MVAQWQLFISLAVRSQRKFDVLWNSIVAIGQVGRESTESDGPNISA